MFCELVLCCPFGSRTAEGAHPAKPWRGWGKEKCAFGQKCIYTFGDESFGDETFGDESFGDDSFGDEPLGIQIFVGANLKWTTFPLKDCQMCQAPL